MMTAVKNEGKKLKSAIMSRGAMDSIALEDLFEDVRTDERKMLQSGVVVFSFKWAPWLEISEQWIRGVVIFVVNTASSWPAYCQQQVLFQSSLTKTK